MKDIYKSAYMNMACEFAKTSQAVRLKVGALIVDDNGVISEGVNGMPPKWPTEVCENKEYVKDEYWYLFDNSQEVKDETLVELFRLYPYKDDHEKGHYKLVTKPECRHAEVAALEKLWNKPNVCRGASIFISHSPCYPCSIKLFTAGIKHVYYRTQFRTTEGIEYLLANNVEVEQIQEN